VQARLTEGKGSKKRGRPATVPRSAARLEPTNPRASARPSAGAPPPARRACKGDAGFSFPNYLAELGDKAQTEIFAKSSLDGATRDAFREMRHFLMAAKGLAEAEAISLMSTAVDFGVTQVVDANWGVHAILKEAIFVGEIG